MKKIKPSEGNQKFCMAPWTHTYLSPQLERRLCCTSKEIPKNFKQYIDAAGSTSNTLKFQTLEQHWNSPHMQNIRKQLMAGEEIPSCAVCNYKLLNAAPYRQHFNRMYADRIEEAFASTDENGKTSMECISFDYRFSNLCNFKCIMCGDMLSSSWESENKTNNIFNYEENPWGKPEIKKEIQKFIDQEVIKEFQNAIEQKKIREFYWVGGEPLMWKIHWESMQRVIDLGYANEVYARYNSNMSRIDFYGKNLFDDCLKYFNDWQICASIDATGEVGEYIRTGLNYNKWLENIKYAKKFVKHPRQLQLDLTITMPGLVDMTNMFSLSKELKLPLLFKKVFSFDPSNVWTPLCLPKKLLHDIVDETIGKTNEKKNVFNISFFEGLDDLKKHKTYEEIYEEKKYKEGLRIGKARVQHLDKIRNTNIEKILEKDKRLLEWWKNI